MTTLEILLVSICSVMALIIASLSAHCIVRRIHINKLSDSIDRFLENGNKTDFSPLDNNFARLQNSVSDLERRLELEKNNTVIETKRNVDFVADISHQLKTPLAGLKLYCEMERDSAPTPYTEKELLLIGKMEKLIRDLLKLEKIRSDAYTMEYGNYAVEDIIGELIGEFRHLFPNKCYTVKGKSTVRCDKSWMGEALGNIIKNAGEHTEENGNIDIIIENGEKSTLIVIEDDGGGIPGEQLPLLFRRFYRSEKASPDSVGIGLAITREIIEKHHGTVSAENGKKGLKVIICLPVIDANIKI